VETKQIVSSHSNVILTRQTCGQCSGMAAASKRRALAFYFSVQICYKFLISKCRGESDLGLCMTSELVNRIRLWSADFRFLNVFGRKIPLNTHLRFNQTQPYLSQVGIKRMSRTVADLIYGRPAVGKNSLQCLWAGESPKYPVPFHMLLLISQFWSSKIGTKAYEISKCAISGL